MKLVNNGYAIAIIFCIALFVMAGVTEWSLGHYVPSSIGESHE